MSNLPDADRAKAAEMARSAKMVRHERTPDSYTKTGYRQAIDELDAGLGSGPGSLLQQVLALITVAGMTDIDKATCVCAYFDVFDDELARIYNEARSQT